MPDLNRSRIPKRLEQVSTANAASRAAVDTDGNVVPVWKGHGFTYDDAGNLATDTVSDGTDTWVRTYVWDSGAIVSDSGWVKQ